MTAMSSMNETALAPGIGGVALNCLRISGESALKQRRPRLHDCCDFGADSITSKLPTSKAKRGLGGSRAYRFDA